jgi:WhiB family redox-sensing transcriptional regulator
MADAACREHPELSFHLQRGASAKPLKDVCAGCLVREECLDYALAMDREGGAHGFWGGMSPAQRVTLPRRPAA